MASSTHTSFTSLSLGDLDGVVHVPKQVEVVLVGVVDDLLAAVDELELDPTHLVSRLEEVGRDLDLWEGAGNMTALCLRLRLAHSLSVRWLHR